ncbi:MAG: hypothetical protein WBG36_06705 [Ornithinimicrobium sp.]
MLGGINGYLTAKNTTMGGKVADAVLTGATSTGMVLRPGTALLDLVLSQKYNCQRCIAAAPVR